MQRKKVLILGHSDATQFIDIFNEYAALFDRNRYEVTVAYLTGEPSEKTKDRTKADQVIFLTVSKKVLRGLKISAIRQLLALTRQNQYEIVICHRYKPAYIMMWVAQFCRIPVLLSVMHELGTMASPMRKLVIALLRRKNMLFGGVSNAVRDDIRRSLSFVPAENIVTLYNMIDVNFTEPQLLSREAAREALQLDNDAFVFGNIGRLAINKDQKTLINAFAKVKATYPNSKLIILGDGELEAELKAHASACGVAHDVILTGFVPGAFRYMKAFDCFVLSSKQEAFGRVLLEAMIAKLPIIASRVNGIPEVVGQIGTLIEAGNSDQFAAAMQKALACTMEERLQQGQLAYQRVSQSFSMPQFHEQFWQLPLLQRIKEPSCA